ncbi:hypothetical protein AOLI_G00153240 [Acnodon oligacanthus]
MRTAFSLLLVLFLQQRGSAWRVSPENGVNALFIQVEVPEVNPNSGRPGPDPQPKKSPRDRLSLECLKEKYTRLSCSKVFCPPWRRCINGQCVCKLPYQCPRLGRAVCGLNGQSYVSFCQAQVVACRSSTAVFSHYGSCDEDGFKVELKKSGDRDVVQVETLKGKALICGAKSWDMAAANVVCRSLKAEARGAASAQKMTVKDLEVGPRWPSQCMSVSCTGSEYSLAECTIYEPQDVEEDTPIAAFTCYKKPQGAVPPTETTISAKVGRSTVSPECVFRATLFGMGSETVSEETMKSPPLQWDLLKLVRFIHFLSAEPVVHNTVQVRLQPEPVWQSPKNDILQYRNYTESQLECGIPNMDYVHRTRGHFLSKRMVGGQEALPWQFQWQALLMESHRVRCGGVYLGGCWVLTAAHCVRAKPKLFRVMLSLWNIVSPLATTDAAPVKNIIIHKDYNPHTYQNDIALVQLEELGGLKECLQPNPAIRAVCVPWSPLQFQPGDTCTVSGWGKNRGHWPRGQTHGRECKNGLCRTALRKPSRSYRGKKANKRQQSKQPTPILTDSLDCLYWIWSGQLAGSFNEQRLGRATFPGRNILQSTAPVERRTFAAAVCSSRTLTPAVRNGSSGLKRSTPLGREAVGMPPSWTCHFSHWRTSGTAQ